MTDQECPKCGVNCTEHNDDQRYHFALEALQDAANQFHNVETRGASMLIGCTITTVDATSLNQIILTDNYGKKYRIDTKTGPYGIPVVIVTKEK